MDPTLIAACIAMSLAGGALGLFSGLVPGIHVNTLAAMLLNAYPAIEASVPLGEAEAAVAVGCCIMSASVVHSFVDFVPSVFIGAPDAEDAVSVLPGHRLLLMGRGMEAVRAAAIGSVIGCSVSIALALPLQWALLNGAEDALDLLTPVVLITACILLLSSEWRRGSGLWGPAIMGVSGILGLGCMVLPVPTEGILGEGSVMMPLLTGLFGIPVLLETGGNARVPAQSDRVTDPVGPVPGIRGVLMGTVAGWFPGITSTVGASMSAAVFPERDPARFISTVASVGTVTSVLALVTLSVSGSGRSGTALVIGDILGDSLGGFASPPFLLLLLSAAMASVMGYWLTIASGRMFTRFADRIRPKALSGAMLVFLAVLTLALNGPAGLVVLVSSTAVGLLPGICGTGRVILCGSLILPVLAFEFGLFRSLELRIRLRHELGVIDDEALVGPRADLALGVPDDDAEHQPPAVDLHELRLARDLHPDRSGGGVGNIQVRADGAGPGIEMRCNAEAGGGLYERDHGRGGEHRQCSRTERHGGVVVGDPDGPRSSDACFNHDPDETHIVHNRDVRSVGLRANYTRTRAHPSRLLTGNHYGIGMGLEDDLYDELFELRETLRDERKQPNGRIPQICSDEALREMAQRVPTKTSDFSAIVGVGQRFVEQYGEDFLEVTRKYAITAANGSNIDTEAAQTLRELEKKLININKSNRLLFQPKISRKNAFDLMTLPDVDIMGLVFGNKRSLKLVDTAKGPEAAKAYKHLNEVIREVNREQRDKGQYDLYVAYPFVEGKMPDGELDIRAPLALFPVVLEKDTRVITLKMDDSRDAIYNNTLILGFIKAGGNNRPLPDNILEDYIGESFMSNLIDFYDQNGIHMEYHYSMPVPFVEYKAGEFPKYQPGETKLVPNILIGKYPTYSSSIQKDFDGMLAGREINGILNDLIVDLNKTDYLSDLPMPLSEEEIESKGLEASERDLIYINSLNSSQENIISAMDKGDEIVVQGPPGTGKSQVITGLITSAVMKGKTVLMVSEKKTALDVVYSRLGTLSKYCLQIDDVANKESFYKQLARMLESAQPKRPVDVDSVSDQIDNDVLLLDNIADVMYKPGDFGIEPYKLYAMDRWLNLDDRRQFDEYKVLKDNIEPSLLNLKYPAVRELHRRFGDPTLMKNFDEYKRLVQANPWMTQMKADLSEYNIGEMKADLLDLDKQLTEWRSKGFMSKMFSKGKISREATSMVDKYFANYNEHTVNSVLDNPRSYFDALDGYETYSSRATVYGRLTDDEKNYGDDILAVSGETRMTFQESNDRIFDWILNEHLQMFDAAHKDIMQEIWDFESIISDMDRKITEKRALCRDKVEEIFQQNLKYITESKRRGDINRIVESKRKWNLNKFIGRYGYELFKGVRVWLLTPEVVSEILPLEMGIFDVLIFDEASQMYVEKGVPSIYRAKKVIVAGDHKQLRPSSLGVGRIDYESDEDDPEDDVSAALEEESLLDLARARYDSILLNFHYRSKYEELIAFSNYAFYGGRLYVSPNVEEPERPPIEVFRVNGLWEDKSNMAEAKEIVSLLKEFFANRKENETVGVITFNSSQRDLISDVLDEECASDPSFGKAVNDEMRRFDNGEDVGLFIKNIESVQGDERDVIMFSVGYAKNSEGKLMQRFGWLNNRGGENRLNVAISRAKKKIMIVTSFDPEDLQVDNVKNDGPRILKKYLQYARAVSDGDKEMADSILKSFGDERWTVPDEIGESRIADRVYNALVRKGYTVERNVGIGGYQIDLAVKQNNRYILGIECDTHLYTLPASTRERDYHRQKYLESRGWRIHRVWTPGMWKSPDREIARIIEAIERSTDSA